jgi:hypothetical protein
MLLLCERWLTKSPAVFRLRSMYRSAEKVSHPSTLTACCPTALRHRANTLRRWLALAHSRHANDLLSQVIEFLEQHDQPLARLARKRYAVLNLFKEEAQE